MKVLFDLPIPKHTFLITTMKDEFFDQGRNGNRDGYTPRNEQAGRSAGRSARPRFARESRVGSSSPVSYLSFWFSLRCRLREP